MGLCSCGVACNSMGLPLVWVSTDPSWGGGPAPPQCMPPLVLLPPAASVHPPMSLGTGPPPSQALWPGGPGVASYLLPFFLQGTLLPSWPPVGVAPPGRAGVTHGCGRGFSTMPDPMQERALENSEVEAPIQACHPPWKHVGQGRKGPVEGLGLRIRARHIDIRIPREKWGGTGPAPPCSTPPTCWDSMASMHVHVCSICMCTHCFGHSMRCRRPNHTNPGSGRPYSSRAMRWCSWVGLGSALYCCTARPLGAAAGSAMHGKLH